MTPEEINKRIEETESAYQRQLNLSGKKGYDHTLTEHLKKDLDWLQEQRKVLLPTEQNNEGINNY